MHQARARNHPDQKDDFEATRRGTNLSCQQQRNITIGTRASLVYCRGSIELIAVWHPTAIPPRRMLLALALGSHLATGNMGRNVRAKP